MTSGVQGSTTGATPGAVASGAALIATFYCPRKQATARLLEDRLRRALNLKPRGPRRYLKRRGPRRWSDPAGKEAVLIRFDLAHDATALQLALNAPAGDAAADGWEELRQKLEGILEAEALDGIWGYTLTYQAVLDPGVGEDQALDQAFKELRPVARRLHSPREEYSLAQADVAGGRMWLLGIPTEGGGPGAATVYVALSTSEEAGTFVKAFYGEDAALMMPDLISHKSYFEKHQYHGSNLKAYKADLKTFRETTGQLLDDLGQQNPVESDKLTSLTRDYNELVKRVWDLEDLRVSMAQQLHNYEQWPGIEDNDILEYHRRHIQTINAELQPLVTEGRYALGVADPVLSIAQLQADKVQEAEQRQTNQDQAERHRRIAVVLAVVAAALTVPELVDQQAAAALLWLLGMRELDTTSNPDMLVILVTQVIIIAVVAFLLKFWVIDRKSSKPRENTRSGDREAS